MIDEEEIVMNELINPKLNDWEEISKYEYLAEEFIERYKDRLDWFWVSMKQRLSEGFIDKYQDRIGWESISKYQQLSEKFIEENRDKIDWFWVRDRKSTRLNSSHANISYAVFCL